ncbi:hypothetical protein D3C81_1698670 [compost metagenome]
MASAAIMDWHKKNKPTDSCFIVSGSRIPVRAPVPSRRNRPMIAAALAATGEDRALIFFFAVIY